MASESIISEVLAKLNSIEDISPLLIKDGQTFVKYLFTMMTREGDVLPPLSKEALSLVVKFATNNMKAFRHHIKYRTCFCNMALEKSLRDSHFIVQCPRIARGDCPSFGFPLKAQAHNYVVDLFMLNQKTADKIMVKKTMYTNRIDVSNVREFFANEKIRMIAPAKDGDQAIASPTEFIERLNAVLQNDPVLRDIIMTADISKHYCVAGGFVAKLLDSRKPDLQASDVDIFVYGTHQEQMSTINELYKKLYVANRTYTVTRGSVISIYRVGAKKVQIVSSAMPTYESVVTDFDITTVMAGISDGRVFASVAFVEGMRTATAKLVRRFGGSFITKRIVKPISLGFDITTSSSAGFRTNIIKCLRQEDKILQAAKAINLVIPLIEGDDFSNIAFIECMEGEKVFVLSAYQDNMASGMVIGRRIVHYAARFASDIDWKMVDVHHFPFAVGSHRSMTFSGIRQTVLMHAINIREHPNGAGWVIATLSIKDTECMYDQLEGLVHHLEKSDLAGCSISFGHLTDKTLARNEFVMRARDAHIVGKTVIAELIITKVSASAFTIDFEVLSMAKN